MQDSKIIPFDSMRGDKVSSITTSKKLKDLKQTVDILFTQNKKYITEEDNYLKLIFYDTYRKISRGKILTKEEVNLFINHIEDIRSIIKDEVLKVSGDTNNTYTELGAILNFTYIVKILKEEKQSIYKYVLETPLYYINYVLYVYYEYQIDLEFFPEITSYLFDPDIMDLIKSLLPEEKQLETIEEIVKQFINDDDYDDIVNDLKKQRIINNQKLFNNKIQDVLIIREAIYDIINKQSFIQQFYPSDHQTTYKIISINDFTKSEKENFIHAISYIDQNIEEIIPKVRTMLDLSSLVINNREITRKLTKEEFINIVDSFIKINQNIDTKVKKK